MAIDEKFQRVPAVHKQLCSYVPSYTSSSHVAIA